MRKSLKNGGSCKIRTCDQLVKSQTEKIEVQYKNHRIAFNALRSSLRFFGRFASLIFSGLQNVLRRERSVSSEPDRDEVRFIWLSSAISAALLMGMLLGMCSQARADGFTVEDAKISIGRHCLDAYGDGLWRQEGGPLWWTAHRCDTSKSIGLGGRTPIGFVDWSFWYTHRGSFTGRGSFTSDDRYLAGDFTPTYSSQYRGSTRAFVLTLDPTYRTQKLDIFARVGWQMYKAKLKFINTDADTGEQLMHHFEETGGKPYTAIGIRYKGDGALSVFADCYRTHESPPEAPNSGRTGCNVGIEIGI